MAPKMQILRGPESARGTVTPLEGELLFTTDNYELFVGDGTTAGGKPLTAPSVREIKTQAAHSFVVGDVLRHDGASFVLTDVSANVGDQAEVFGIVDRVVDVDNFSITYSGKVVLSGLTPGAVYYVDPDNPGKVTDAEPHIIGQVHKPVGMAINSTDLIVMSFRGTEIITPITMATTATPGLVELATQTEVFAGTDPWLAITPATLAARTATETRTGILAIATDADVDAGLDDTKALTPLKLKNKISILDGGLY